MISILQNVKILMVIAALAILLQSHSAICQQQPEEIVQNPIEEQTVAQPYPNILEDNLPPPSDYLLRLLSMNQLGTNTVGTILTTSTTSSSPLHNYSSSDYFPCTFYEVGPGVGCKRIPMKEVKALFHQLTTVTNLAEMVLLLRPLEEYVPSHILGTSHRITNILKIMCSANRLGISATKLRVNKDAFAFTKDVTRAFRIDNCDLSHLNWGFLAGFNNLNELVFDLTPNFHLSFPTLPPLSALSTISILGVSSAFDEFIVFPELAKGLETFKITNLTSEKATASIHGMMNWLYISSTETLKTLAIQDVNLWEIPPQLPSFERLEKLAIEGAKIPAIMSHAIQFSAPVIELSFFSSGINHIEPGAFQGNFTNANVLLNKNNLTRFESNVFRTMLRQMDKGTGILAVRSNPFDCETDPCHLAWLIRDERHLLGSLAFAMCTKNGIETPFLQVDESWFDNCPCTDCIDELTDSDS